jgi:ankyrin repeat protein
MASTPLHDAAQNGNIAIVSSLISKFDVNGRDKV